MKALRKTNSILLGMMLSSTIVYSQCPSVSQINDGDGSPEYSFTVTGNSCDIANAGTEITQGYNNGVESILIIAEGASLTINENFLVYDSVKVYGTLIVNGDMAVASQDGIDVVLYVAETGSVTINGDYTNGGEDAVLIIIPLDEGDPGNTHVEGEMTVNGTYTNNDGGTTTVADGGTMQTESWDQQGGDVYVSGGDVGDCATGCCGGGCAALPVTLLSFSVDQLGSDARLTWSTAQEINNHHFVIQKRCADEQSFADIAQVTGAGTINHKIEYQYIDLLFDQDSYYRLVQVDHDGQHEILSMKYLDMDLSGLDSEVLIYPNPTTASFQLMTDDELTIRVVDMSGSILYEGENITVNEAEERLNLAVADKTGSFYITFFERDRNYTKAVIKY